MVPCFRFITRVRFVRHCFPPNYNHPNQYRELMTNDLNDKSVDGIPNTYENTYIVTKCNCFGLENTKHPLNHDDYDYSMYAVKFTLDGKSILAGSANKSIRVIETSNGVQYILPRPSKWALGMPVTSIRFIPTKYEWAIECNSQGEVFTFKPDLEGFETIFKEPQQTHTLDLSPDGHEFATDGTDRRIRIYTIRPDGLVGLQYEISNKTSDFSRGYGGNQLSGGMQKLTSDTLKNKNYEVLNKNNTYGSNYPDGRPSQILNTTVKPYSLTQCYNLHETHQLSTYEPTAFSDQHQSDHHHFFVIPSLREYLATSPGINIIEGHSMRIMALKYHLNKSTMLISAGWDNLVKIWDFRALTSSTGEAKTFHLNTTGLTDSSNDVEYTTLNQFTSFQSFKQNYKDGPVEALSMSGSVWGEYGTKDAGEYLYASKFLPCHAIVAGFSGFRQIRVIGRDTHLMITFNKLLSIVALLCDDMASSGGPTYY
ncbi:unnamed protein product [Heterobilharzia americana]|nr:unnamed protein product [Heterobilharzia americana]